MMEYDFKRCINCLCVEHRFNDLVCIIHDRPVNVDDVCSQWEPDESTELIMLRKENAELKKRNKKLEEDVEPLLEQIVTGKQCWSWGELMLVRTMLEQIKEVKEKD